jgi:hypothetical protein
MGEMDNANIILVGKPRERNQLGALDVDARIM